MLEQENGGVAGGGQSVGTRSDVGNINGARFHGGNLGGAIGKLIQLMVMPCSAITLDTRNYCPESRIVGHVGNVQGNRLLS